MALCSSRNGNRTASPMSARPNPNPNPNTSSNQNGRSNQPDRDQGVIRSCGFSGNGCSKPSLIPQLHAPPSSSSALANGPADNVRRSFSGRECLLSSRDNDHKENEKDVNSRPVRARSSSPSRSLSRGTKNFMSPTISAVSKINPSPKRKVLTERNEAVRASASLVDGKFHFFSVDSPVVAEDCDSVALAEDPYLKNSEDISSAVDLEKKRGEDSELFSKGCENKVDSSVASGFLKLEEPDMVVLSPEKSMNITRIDSFTSPATPNTMTNTSLSINSANASPCAIAPLDADPSLPPYDPKTNWLSPRPQFLHYKPNSRIELYLSNDKRLEEENPYDSSSESESSPGTMSEDSQVVEDVNSVEMVAAGEREDEDAFIKVSEETESGQHEEPDGASSIEMAIRASEETKISQPEGASSDEMAADEDPKTQFSDATVPPMLNETVESKVALSKTRFSSRSKVLAFLFTLSLAFLPILILYTPSSLSPKLQPQTIVELYNNSHIQPFEVNLNAFLPRVGPWSVPFGNYLSEKSFWYRDVENVRLLQLSNSTLPQSSSTYVQEEVELPVIDDTGVEHLYDGEITAGLVEEIAEPEMPTGTDPAVVHERKSNLEMEEYAPATTFSNEDITMNSAAKGNEGDSSFDPSNGSACDADLANESSTSLAEGSEILSFGQATELVPFVYLDQVVATQLNNDINSDMQDEQQSDDDVEAEKQSGFLSHDTENLESCNDINPDIQDKQQHTDHADIQDKQQHTDHAEAEDQSSFLSHDEENNESCYDLESEKPEEVPEGNLVVEENLGDDRLTDATVSGYRFMDQSYQGFFLLCALFVAIAFMFLAQRKRTSAIREAPVSVKDLPAENLVTKPEASPKESSLLVSPSSPKESLHLSHSGPIEMDMGSEPCPSEMSSFQKISSSPYSERGPRAADEVQSQEKKPRRNHRRESLASSSTDHTIASTSYGSFTTYDIVHSKHGDEEVVTPVRRSSRLRNVQQVTSP